MITSRKFRQFNFIEDTFTIKEVFELHFSTESKKTFKNIPINYNSRRNSLFIEKGCDCVKCGLKGTHFRLQRHQNKKTGFCKLKEFHFGLWSDNGIPLTLDHIIPTDNGGANNMSNFQVMCGNCNGSKGNKCSIEDIENGTSIDGSKPIVINNIRVKGLRDVVNPHIVMRDYDEKLLAKNNNIIKRYMMRNRVNPFLVSVENIEIMKSVEYCLNVYKTIIRKREGVISPSSNHLKALPNKVSRILIKEILEEFGRTKETLNN